MEKFSKKTTFQIGIKIIDLLEDLHSIGVIHNDLKLNNLCVGGPKSDDELDELKLIDFGIASSYVTKENLFREPTSPEHHILKSRK